MIVYIYVLSLREGTTWRRAHEARRHRETRASAFSPWTRPPNLQLSEQSWPDCVSGPRSPRTRAAGGRQTQCRSQPTKTARGTGIRKQSPHLHPRPHEASRESSSLLLRPQFPSVPLQTVMVKACSLHRWNKQRTGPSVASVPPPLWLLCRV